MAVDRHTLAPIGYGGRADAIRARLADGTVGALLVSSLANVRWLTAFTGSNGTAAVLPDRVVLVTDGRYRDRAVAEAAAAGVDVEVVVGASLAQQQARLVAELAGVAAVGADPASLTHQRWEALAAELPIVACGGVVEDARRSKDAGEVERIAAAAGCADAALTEVVGMLAERPTEADVRNELEFRMRRHGADGPSYDTIVASGPEHAARPHHQTGDRTIVEGDTVVIDVGALVDGYHSDMTRSFVVGEPTPHQRQLYDLLLEIQLAGLAAVRSGQRAADVDATCRTLVAEHGLSDWFLHATGHGVGLLIHEDPFANPSSTLELRPGDVVTVEPGLYRVGFGGLRIEDLVEVTSDGCRILTSFPKDSPCLPSPPTT